MTSDIKYGQTLRLGDAVFEQHFNALSDKFEHIIADAAARGFSYFDGTSIGPMSDATVDAIRRTSGELLDLYSRAFATPDGPDTLAAVESKLAEHLGAQMTSLAEAFHGTVEARGGKRYVGQVDQALQSALIQIRHRVALIAAGRAP